MSNRQIEEKLLDLEKFLWKHKSDAQMAVEEVRMEINSLRTRIDKAKTARDDLAMDISTLREQIRCAAKGHVSTVISLGKSFGFRCVECDLRYLRDKDSLTPHEQELVDVTKKG